MMKTTTLLKLLQIISFSMCVIVAIKHSDLVFVDFNGGMLTEPLLTLNTSGGRLFVSAMILLFIDHRLASIGGLMASFLCLPLYFFLVAPGIIRHLFPDAFWRHSHTNFFWNEWAFIGILLLVMTDFVCFLSLSTARMKPENESNRLRVRTKTTITLQKLSQIAVYLICAIVILKLAFRFHYPEWHENTLLDLNGIGFFMLLFALVLILMNSRRAATCALIGSLLNLPLYLYLVVPFAFHWFFNLSILPSSPPPVFVWDVWALIAILTMAPIVYICISNFNDIAAKAPSSLG